MENKDSLQATQTWHEVLAQFITDANSGTLKTAHYPKEWLGLTMKVSFGMGAPARVPWIALTSETMTVSRGIYPVYLYYKDLQTLILAYGISETEESPETWPVDVLHTATTIESYFDTKIPRYGSSFVFKVYKIEQKDSELVFTYANDASFASPIDLESDLQSIVTYYEKSLSLPSNEAIQQDRIQGLFYMEKQLEDFIIYNWSNTELGKQYDLIIEEGVPKSQQYRTDIGPIDILAVDKETKDYVVIELKRNQTSDDTVGQLTRYMGWVKENLCSSGNGVRGVIIAGKYDQKLDYALRMVPDVDVFIYEVDFTLKEFTK